MGNANSTAASVPPPLPPPGFYDSILGAIGVTVFKVGIFLVAMGVTSAAVQVFDSVRSRNKPIRPIERFADVAGVDAAVDEMRDIVEILRAPKRFAALGAKAPRGVLLTGGPGLGKTLLARATAGEAGFAFLATSGSSFDEIWVGQGAKRVRQLFADARRLAPCVVFIDEIDAVGASRNSSDCQTLNQLLVELGNTSALVIAATNRADVLDDALVRKGRFDVHVQLHAPDARGREAILQRHARDRPLARDVDLARLAAATRGFSGADLASLVNAAAASSVRCGRSDVSWAELDVALNRATLGIERKTDRSPEDSEIVAFHEAGHAVVAARLLPPGSVRAVSIVARGVAGGVTVMEPPGDLASLDDLERRLAVLLGGRAGEELRLCSRDRHRAVTTGASADLEAATELARGMVEKLGLGRDVFPEADAVPRQVHDLLAAALKRARRELSRRSAGDLKRVAKALLERSTLSGAELQGVLENTRR
jgi:ATP-dependent metalloprotease FtsH